MLSSCFILLGSPTSQSSELQTSGTQLPPPRALHLPLLPRVFSGGPAGVYKGSLLRAVPRPDRLAPGQVALTCKSEHSLRAGPKPAFPPDCWQLKGAHLKSALFFMGSPTPRRVSATEASVTRYPLQGGVEGATPRQRFSGRARSRLLVHKPQVNCTGTIPIVHFRA